jgi:hypothetical protein
MKKLAIAATTIVAALGITTSAMADTYSNVGSKITPAKSGTKLAPKPESAAAIFSVTPASPTVRPGIVQTYTIGLGEGVVENSALFKSCSDAVITGPGGTAACPAESKLGGGVAYNRFGPTADLSSISECDLKLTLFNGGTHKVNLVVQADPSLTCAIQPPPTVVPGVFKKIGGITNLIIVVPSTLVHPLTGLDNALYKTTTTLGKTKSAKVAGKTRKAGYLETISCPKSKKRKLVTKFQGEKTASTPNPPTFSTSTTSKCS